MRVSLTVAALLLAGCAHATTPAEQTTDDAGASVLAAEPGSEAWSAYIAALDDIDPDIVHGKEEKAVDRGRDQCASVKESPDDQDRLIARTKARFTSPDHPDGFGAAKAKRILKAVRTYICPEY